MRSARPAGGGGTAVERAAQSVLSSFSSSTVLKAREVASLWAGYGTITEVRTDDKQQPALIIKHVAPPPGSGVSHQRKLQSYIIEAAFYQRVVPHLPRTGSPCCHVPECVGVHSSLDAAADQEAGEVHLVMGDLRSRFPSQCSGLDEQQAKAALLWLAAFHAACWGADAQGLGLWRDGCYWHLETRLEELEDIGHDWRQLKAAAHEVDRRLRDTPFRTLTHGDFKTANLLFGSGGGSNGGLECAAYDFQYVGGGTGLKDVVYLFVSGLSGRVLQQQEEALLRFYHTQLLEGLRATALSGESGSGTSIADPTAVAAAIEQYTFEAMMGDYKLALVDYVRFMAGWGFWGQSKWAATKARQFMDELGLDT